MINLLPEDEKKQIHREYMARFMIATLGLLAATGVVLIGSYIPSYFLRDVKVAALTMEKEKLNTSQGVKIDTDMAAIIADINKRLALFPDPKLPTIRVTEDIVLPLLSAKSSSITIREVGYINMKKAEIGVSVGGVASTRSALVEFQRSLEGLPHFKSVTLPVSDFIRDKDIEFNLEIRVTP